MDVRQRMRRFSVQSATVESRRLVPLAFALQDDSPIVKRFTVARTQLHGMLKRCFGLAEPPALETKHAEIVISLGVIGIERDGVVVGLFRFAIPAEAPANRNQIDVRV